MPTLSIKYRLSCENMPQAVVQIENITEEDRLISPLPVLPFTYINDQKWLTAPTWEELAEKITYFLAEVREFKERQRALKATQPPDWHIEL